MRMHEPLISIVVPSYNHAPFVTQCIESIVKQDYENYELIVIDDGSQDESPRILEELQRKHGFYLELNQNQGLSRTLNHCLRNIAKGKYYTFCASDDYWAPDKLRKQVNFLETNPNCAMVYSKAIIVDENGYEIPEETNKRNKNLIGGEIFENLMMSEFHPPVNYMLRSDVVKELGYYREKIWAEDYDMNLRISYKYHIGFINEFLSFYRVDSKQKNKMLNFKTIYSHLDSINQFKDSVYYRQALKNWYYKCFLWYSPYRIGKKIAFIGMIHNLNKFFQKEFLIFLLVLLRKWK